MITEDYVSFETAKLLKEKGFEGKIHTFYTEDGKEMESSYVVPSNFFPIYRPTLQMVMKWLRDVHKIQIELVIAHAAMKKRWSYGINKDFNPYTQKIEVFRSYEEACEAAIKYCLENLV